MTDAELLEAVREFIRSREHCDSWNVPCVYTKGLRELLGMPETTL